MNLTLITTDSSNTDFRNLVAELDKDLSVRDGDEHGFYSQYNKLDLIKHVVVAYLENKAIACGAFKEYEAGTVEIKRMFVLREYRGHGIALKVLSKLEQWASSLNYNACVLETGKKQPEAIALYQKAGYGIIPNYGQYEGIENSVCMRKTI